MEVAAARRPARWREVYLYEVAETDLTSETLPGDRTARDSRGIDGGDARRGAGDAEARRHGARMSGPLGRPPTARTLHVRHTR